MRAGYRHHGIHTLRALARDAPRQGCAGVVADERCRVVAQGLDEPRDIPDERAHVLARINRRLIRHAIAAQIHCGDVMASGR